MSEHPHHHAKHQAVQEKRAIALAAVVLSASLVESIARNGRCDQEDFETLIGSLFRQDGDRTDIAALYGNAYQLRGGLHLSAKLLTGTDLETAKPLLSYSAGLMALEKKLSKNGEMLAAIAEGMERIRKQSDYFGSTTHASVIGGIADLYGKTVSTLKPPIIVRGKPEHLNHGDNRNKVRALLLAGIRAAHLWHRHGGGHLRLFLGRKKLHQHTIRLLEESSSV